jgi:hypothetical protein
LKGIRFGQWRWGTAAVLLSCSAFLSNLALAQAGPPAPTVQEQPSLENPTLQAVKYDNKYELYGGPAFSHFNSGPSLIAGTNLGGFDIQGTRWFTGILGATANIRGYYGTQGVVPNALGIHGPFVYQHQFMGGVTVRGPKSEHAALMLHAFAGGSYGVFNSATEGVPPQVLGMFPNGFAFATALGGSLDLNRSPRIALRLSPDYILTRFGGVSQNEFAISVGVLYRFSKKRVPQH